MQLSWTDPFEEMMDKKDNSCSNHRFLESNVKNKAKKERENPALANCVEGWPQ